ncbi:hypothetical protein QFZ43_006763 [Streptomyces afghaniensis]|nr:hypothetical protein [Streptomyces afghaniensis]
MGGDGLAALLQFAELLRGLLAVLGEFAHGLLELLQLTGLVGRDAVQAGGLVEVVVRVVGEQQGEGRVDAARPVLGAGERTERFPHGVDALLLTGDPVPGGADLVAQPVGALVGLVVGLGRLLGLLVEAVHRGPGVVVRCGRGRYRAQGGGRDGKEADRETGAPVEPGRCKAAMGPHGKPFSFRWRTRKRGRQ